MYILIFTVFDHKLEDPQPSDIKSCRT